MKQNWELEELIEHWMLLPDELVLLGNKTGATRLGFAVLLKYFQQESYFPSTKPNLPRVVINHIASQVGVPPELYPEYNWSGRMAKYHRHQIREFFGFRKATVRDAKASLEKPEGTVKEVIYPVVGEKTLKDLVQEMKANGTTYQKQVHTVLRSSYSRHYRRALPQLLSVLEFRSNNEVHRPVIEALELLKKYAESKQRYYSLEEQIPIEGVLKSGWQSILVEQDKSGRIRINRINYEISVLQALRERLRCKEIWVVGANRYRNPEEDLPTDFEQHREAYYQALKLPTAVDDFITPLKQAMEQALSTLNEGLPQNSQVNIINKGKGRICLSPLEAQPEPTNILRLKTELIRRRSLPAFTPS